MDNRKIRVAITHGDTNGIGYEVILKAFEDPTMFDLCTPIVYGSPKVASYHRKALSLETQFSIIEKAEDARDGRLNLLSTFDEEVKVELGTPTEESDSAARKAVARAKEDLQKGLYDVLVQAPMKSNANPSKEDRSLTMMVSDLVRIGLVTTHLPLKDVRRQGHYLPQQPASRLPHLQSPHRPARSQSAAGHRGGKSDFACHRAAGGERHSGLRTLRGR